MDSFLQLPKPRHRTLPRAAKRPGYHMLFRQTCLISCRQETRTADWLQREFLRRTIMWNWKCRSIYFLLRDERNTPLKRQMLFTVRSLQCDLSSKHSRDYSCPKTRQKSHWRKLKHPQVTDMWKSQNVRRDYTTKVVIWKDLQTDVTESQIDIAEKLVVSIWFKPLVLKD